MIPAAPTSLDVALWLLERGAADGKPPSAERLRWLLYLAQARFAAANNGHKLMPACFVAATDGPIEPTVARTLTAGLAEPWAPELAEDARRYLEQFWRGFGALPETALRRLIAGDETWRRALAYGAGAEIDFATSPREATGALRARTAAAGAASGKMLQREEKTAGDELRFTADGRLVTRWKPKRRLDPQPS
jgi:uncharacterized phage-associated protein